MNQMSQEHKKQNILYINVDEIDLYYQLYKDKIDKNHDFYLSYVRERPQLYEDYVKLCDTIHDIDRRRQRDIREGDVSLLRRNKFIGPDGEMVTTSSVTPLTQDGQIGQSGGDVLTASIVVGSYVLTGVVAYMLWYFLNKEEGCKPSYPLYPRKKIPDVATILEKILPGDWIKDGIKQGKDIVDVINDSGQFLETLSDAFSIFDETSGSTVKRVLTSTTKIVLSVGAAVLTEGAGGDKIVNIPFFITKAINMTTKTFNKLRKVTAKITKLLKQLTAALKKVQAALEEVVTAVDTLNKNKDAIVNNLRNNKHQITFIYDLFNVNFSGGPVHCKCWVDFIMNYYISSNDRLKEIYMLLCVMNDIYLDINDEIVGFLGSALDMIIPESMGLAGTIAPLLKQFSYVIYQGVRDKLTDEYFGNVPLEIRNLIQNPSTMKKYLFDKFSTYTLGASDLLIPSSVKEYMESGIDVLANGIHKGMSMLFMFLNVFIIFSELNAGVNTSLINQNIDVEKLLKDCAFCGDFKVIGINADGTLNMDDVSNCTRCKKFFVDDEEMEIDENLLYSKCMVYRDRRDQAKAAYQKLKKLTLSAYKKANKGVSLGDAAKKQIKKNPKILTDIVGDVVEEEHRTRGKRKSIEDDEDIEGVKGGSYIEIDDWDDVEHHVQHDVQHGAQYNAQYNSQYNSHKTQNLDTLNVLNKLYEEEEDTKLKNRITFMNYRALNLSDSDKKFIVDTIY